MADDRRDYDPDRIPPREHPEEVPETRDEADVPLRAGDVLGLSDADPDVEIPRATTDRGGNPAGIEVGRPATGTGDVSPGKGATGIDMGAGGSGTGIDPRPTRPTTAPERND